jgi:hypothetical protein
MGPQRGLTRQDLVRSTDYKEIIVLTFGSQHDADRGSVIESAEVPGPVFTEPLDLETVRKVTASREFQHLRSLVHERRRLRASAA